MIGGGNKSGYGWVQAVNNYSALPLASEKSGKVYLVLNNSGLPIISWKSKGLYYSDGSSWIELGPVPDVNDDSIFKLYNHTYPTREMKFDCFGISDNQVRSLKMPDYNFDLEKPAVDYIDLDLTASSSSQIGRIRWNDTDRCIEYDSHIDGSICTAQIPQESWVRVRNNTSSEIENGAAVYVSGAVGNRPSIALAKADSETTSLLFIGLTTQNIPVNCDGFVTTFGVVRGVDTNSYSPGDILYLSASVSGGLTLTRPEAPNQVVAVGIVLTKSGNGDIGVFPRIQPTLERLSGVYAPSKNNKDYLYWIASSSRWEAAPYGKFGDISGGDYSEFETDGTLKYNGDATVWNDLIITASNLRPGVSAPAFSAFTGNIYAVNFINGQTDELHGAVELQHDYEEGTDIEVHVHWSPSSTNTGDCVFGFEYSLANMSTGDYTVSDTIYATQAGSGTALKHQYASFGNIPGEDSARIIKIGSILVFRIFRTGAADAFTGNAFIHSIGIHYKSDTTGSRQMAVK